MINISAVYPFQRKIKRSIEQYRACKQMEEIYSEILQCVIYIDPVIAKTKTIKNGKKETAKSI